MYSLIITGNVWFRITFRHQLKKYAERAGIEKRVYPHLLRHSGVILFLEEGGSQCHLQVILGHADGRMTAHYIHLSDKNVKRNHAEYSPLNAVIGKLESRERRTDSLSDCPGAQLKYKKT
ncbi:tyrosine-type recombinase/integrase [Paenibacillus xylanexedens]|uniref:tyrosine-type recombinase/integrase n=1 Tax=Paenibacillus xylanexedens TaxID=528191 RepID=UPI001B3AFA66